MYDDEQVRRSPEDQKRRDDARAAAHQQGMSMADASRKADEWTADSALRFGITSREILDAVRLGWTPERINELPATEVDSLFEKPAADAETTKLLRHIRSAPILPVPYKSWH